MVKHNQIRGLADSDGNSKIDLTTIAIKRSFRGKFRILKDYFY